MLTPDKAGGGEGKETIAPIEDGEVGKIQQTNKKDYSPIIHKSIKSMEKKNILTCQLNDIRRRCAEISSKNP